MKHLKFLSSIILLLFILPVKAQDSEIAKINNYKYIIVPIQYDFLKKDNEFLLSSLTKHLFKQEGYTVLIDNQELPEDLVSNACLALKVELIGDYKKIFSFNTDLKFKLIDCGKEVVYESVTGSSRKKDFKEAYHEAFREAFSPFKSFYYSYSPNDLGKENPKKTQDFANTALFENVSHYTLKNQTYTLEKTEAGYLLTDENGSKEAFINQTSSGSILYNSERLNGSLIILKNGDLQVEYFNKETGKLEQAIFRKQA